MECYRCGGLMIPDKVYNKASWSEGWRCSLCGEFVDQVILENRLGQTSNRILNPKKRGHVEQYTGTPVRSLKDRKS